VPQLRFLGIAVGDKGVRIEREQGRFIGEHGDQQFADRHLSGLHRALDLGVLISAPFECTWICKLPRVALPASSANWRTFLV